MTGYLIALISAIILTVACYLAVSTYLELRRTSNRLLAVAQKQFSDSVNSMLKTPKDIPAEILSMIRMMGETAFQPGTERALLAQIKKSKMSGGDSTSVDIDTLRPHVKELFGKAAVAWLNIMTHKSTIGGLRIAYAMSKLEAASGEIPVTQTKTALPAMHEMAAALAAA